MTASEIRHEIMAMTYTDPSAVANALEHIADKLIEMEHEIQRLETTKTDLPYNPKERC